MRDESRESHSSSSRRRTSDGSNHPRRPSTSDRTDSRDNSSHGARRSTTGSTNDNPVPAYNSDWDRRPTATAAAAVPAKLVKPTATASAAPAPAFTVPKHRDIRSAEAAVDDVAYFHTEDWPFAAEQHDREKEELLGRDDHVLVGKKEIPQLNAKSCKPIQLGSGALGGALAEWDVECALKHLDAVGPSVVSHEDLHEYTLMEGEFAEDVIDLAGLENAPGLLNDVTQRCRLIFTNKKRLVFTQANHSAEVGVPRMHCCFALLHCFHDRWSTRKWSSFYAAINASEILQVFVQQTLTTNYLSTTCRCDEICEYVWCSVGGSMRSEKDLDQATQTLGDFDQGSCGGGRWDKTRYMRHALVIRYLDCTTNSITQTTAMAHPDTPASKLYEMARSIEANISIRSADWLKCKLLPNPLGPVAFDNALPSPPLIRRTSYKWLVFILFFIGFIFLFINLVVGIFMLIATAIAVWGAYTTAKTRKKVQKAGIFGLKISKTLVGTQGTGIAVYVIALLIGISGN